MAKISWDAMRKTTKAELDLFTDIDIYASVLRKKD